MAFNQKENEIIKWGLANGKSKEEVTQAITNFRTGTIIKPTENKANEQGSISKAFKSGIEKIKEGYTEAREAKNPLELIEGSVKSGAGAIESAFSPLAPVMKPLEKVVEKVSDKISDIPAVQEFAQSKAGEITSRVIEDVANLNTIVGGVAGAKAGVKIPKVAGEVGTKVAQNVKPVVNATGKVLKAGGEASYGVTVTAEEATRRALQTYQAKQPNMLARVENMLKGETKGKPITEANTAARKGLVGTEQELGVQAKRVATDLWKKEIAPKLKESKEKVDMKTFLGEIKKEIKSNPDINRRKSLLTAFEKFANDNKKVGKFGLDKLQDYKVEWAKLVPESSYKGKPISGLLNEIRSIASKKARQTIYDKLGDDTKTAYIDYGNLKSIMEAGIKSGADPAKRSLSRNVWQFVMDKTITPIVTIGGKVLYRTGEGLEFIGEKGAKKVGDIVK